MRVTSAARSAAAVVLAFLAVLYAACGSVQIDTFDKRLAAAYASAAATDDTIAALYAGGRMTKEQALSAARTNASVIAGLTAANALRDTDPAAAQDKLQLTIAGLTTLRNYLASKQASTGRTLP
jgi:hypothetical protein